MWMRFIFMFFNNKRYQVFGRNEQHNLTFRNRSITGQKHFNSKRNFQADKQ
jgi:hypothetical protein